MFTWISLVLNLVLVGFLVSGWLSLRLVAPKKPPAKALLAFLPLVIAMNIDYFPPPPSTPDVGAVEAPGKEPARTQAVRVALAMVGRTMPETEGAEGVLCCDVAFEPWDAACGIRRRIVDDYYSLQNPASRYPARYDVRRCPIRKNAKWIVDTLSSTPRNSPENPFFLRRINNLAAYLRARRLYYPPESIAPRPGMIAFFQRPRDSAPTHVAMIVSRSECGEMEVVQTSGSYDGDGDGAPDFKVVRVPMSYVTDRTRLVAYGDVPIAQEAVTEDAVDKVPPQR